MVFIAENDRYDEDRYLQKSSMSADRGHRREHQSRSSSRHLTLSRPKIYHYKQTKWVNGKG